jgi:hypothetical protein
MDKRKPDKKFNGCLCKYYKGVPAGSGAVFGWCKLNDYACINTMPCPYYERRIHRKKPNEEAGK